MRSRLVTSLVSPIPWEIDALFTFLQNKQKLVVITGAGVSTASGIPDYRGPEGSYKLGHKPMVHNEFISSEISRKRYWVRSFAGFHLFNTAQPNDAHYSIATLENLGIVNAVVTQNVDRLHQKAGSKQVIDLHGRADKVECVACGYSCDRTAVHDSLAIFNPGLGAFSLPSSKNTRNITTRAQEDSKINISAIDGESTGQSLRPDGDANVEMSDFSGVHVPPCPCCGGILKPSVVFFGDTVKPSVVASVVDLVDDCDGLLVVGSSLEVFSAFRFVDRVSKRGSVPIAIINAGETRADRKNIPGIVFRSEAICSELLKSTTSLLSKYE